MLKPFSKKRNPIKAAEARIGHLSGRVDTLEELVRAAAAETAKAYEARRRALVEDDLADAAVIARHDEACRTAETRQAGLEDALRLVKEQLIEAREHLAAETDREERQRTAGAIEAAALNIEQTVEPIEGVIEGLDGVLIGPLLGDAPGAELLRRHLQCARDVAQQLAQELRERADEVLRGTAPARLPDAPQPKRETEPTLRIFPLRDIKWTATDGLRTSARYVEADVPEATAKRALVHGIAVDPSSARANQLRPQRMFFVPLPESCVDLDADHPTTPRRDEQPLLGDYHSGVVPFTVVDRGPAMSGTARV